MILQALYDYYGCLVKSGKLERPGWQPVKVSYALQINDEGKLIRVLPLFVTEERGKKNVQVPQMINVPAQGKKTVGILANFLCDNSSYMLGIDQKGKPERTAECFQAARELHEKMLGGAESPAALAVIRFFQNWQPKEAEQNPALEPYLNDILAGGNLTFDYNQQLVTEDAEIQAVWDRYYAAPKQCRQMRCLVTGETAPVAVLHPSIKGVVGGQTSGTSLVSFNASAYESFGRDGEQGYNAPVSEKAAFAYTAALNYMISQKRQHFRLGDTTIVFWAEHGEDAYPDEFARMMGEDDALTEDDLLDVMKHLAAGRKVVLRDAEINPAEHFYILGLAPNAARLTVRFFLCDRFGAFADHLLKHHERLQIIRPAYDTRASLSFWQLLNETVNQKARDKTPPPLLAGALARAVLMDKPYPRMLLNQAEIRIRAERDINRGKAAIIKAFLLKMSETGMLNKNCKEVFDVELNKETTYQPYLLGRLFAVLEGLQEAANPGINTTIRDRYFNSACATPAVVFPQLIKLAQAHLKKLDTGKRVYQSKQIGQIMEKIDREYPSRLDLYDQGIFQLGYYHQKQTRYTKKEDKNNE